MKKLLFAFLYSGLTLVSFGQALIVENFTGYTPGNLGTQGNWIQSGSGTDVQTGNNSADYLFYPGYTSGSNYVSVNRYTSGGSGTDPRKAFLGNSTVPVNANTSFYMSFVVNVTAAQNAGDYCVALRSSGGSYLMRFYIKRSGSSVQFGISTGTATPAYSANFSTATTYLIIMRQDIITGNNNDQAWLWVNPALNTEPSTGSADASITNGSEGYTSTETVNYLALLQRGSSAPSAFLDGFKLAYGTGNPTTTANSASAWADLSPAGAPLPVIFGSFTASTRNAAVMLNWQILTEVNVDHYAIERSTDGNSFSETGRVKPTAVEGAKTYSFTDNDPASGNNFYRIRTVDRDGKTGYSKVVKIVFGKTEISFSVFPNPVTDKQVSFQSPGLTKGNYVLRLISSDGQEMYHKSFYTDGGMISESIPLPAGVRPGMYTLQLAGDGKSFNRQLVIQ